MVTAIDPLTRNKHKPEFVHGVAFAHKVRSADEPKALAELMPSDFQTGAVKSSQWAESDYGKVADYATAYENTGFKTLFPRLTSGAE